ncbi:unnamed protein product [Closterium sp. NIES-54]
MPLTVHGHLPLTVFTCASSQVSPPVCCCFSCLPCWCYLPVQVSHSLVNRRQFRQQVLSTLVRLYQQAETPDYGSICQMLMFLSDAAGVAATLDRLIKGQHESDALLAYQQGRSLMAPYLPHGAGGGAGAAGGLSGSAFSEGGALYALGLIHANHGESIKGFLLESLRNTSNETIQHGACLGVGLAGMGPGDEEVYEDVKRVLYTDSAVAALVAVHCAELYAALFIVRSCTQRCSLCGAVRSAVHCAELYAALFIVRSCTQRCSLCGARSREEENRSLPYLVTVFWLCSVLRTISRIASCVPEWRVVPHSTCWDQSLLPFDPCTTLNPLSPFAPPSTALPPFPCIFSQQPWQSALPVPQRSALDLLELLTSDGVNF